MATGANTTPLGRLNPALNAGSKPSFGQSLLKPSYMSSNSSGGGGGGEGQIQFSSLFSVVAPPPPPPPPPQQQQPNPQQQQQPSQLQQLQLQQQQQTLNDIMKREAVDMDDDSESARKKRRKSRWGNTEKDRAFIPGMPTVIPSTLSKNQERAYLLQLQIEELSRRLRTGDLGIPLNPEERSPSPEPIYNNEGKRLNTREYRTRKKLEDERHSLIQQMIDVNPEFKPPSDYKPPVVRVSDKVMIPQEEHPDINFVGLLIGPRGNTLKSMEKDTGAKIIIRGKGSVKEGKVSRKDGQPLPGEDEPLHAYVTANNPESVKKAVERIKEIIRQGVEVPEGQNDLRRMQLRELALLNGTLRENDGPRCTNCGASNHKSWQCPDKPNITNNVICSSCGGAGHIAKDCRERRPGMSFGSMAPEKSKIDEEYMSLMAELGEGPPPPTKGAGSGYMSSGGLFGSSGPTRAIMAPPPPPPGSGPNSSVSWSSSPGGKTGGYPQAWNQMSTSHNQYSGPPPPGIMSQPPPPPPPPAASATSQATPPMGWMPQQGMAWPSPVPPPRGGAMVPPPWGANYFGVPPPPPPPPPQGGAASMDISALTQAGLPSLLATPPPPPPT